LSEFVAFGSVWSELLDNVIQVISMKKIPLPVNLPPNMMLALKVSNANQARDMLSVRNVLAQI
jgi:hypothetical protein